MGTVVWLIIFYILGMACVIKMGCDIIDILKDRRK